MTEPGLGSTLRRTTRLLVASVAVAMAAAGCGGGVGSDDEGASQTTGGGGVTRPTVADDGPSDGSLGFTLRFDAPARPAAAIVAHAATATVVAHERPDETSPVVAELSNPTAIGGPLAFLGVDETVEDGASWVEVYLPVRPNGSTGWVRRNEVSLSVNPYRIEIDTSDHRLDVYRSNELWITTAVAIGTGSTPTPIGRFYIIELLQPPNPDGPYGPYAFGLSGYSETLFEYAGGDGVVGIHGTNQPEALGTDVSHGCVRVENEVIESLAGVLPLGTPVDITV